MNIDAGVADGGQGFFEEQACVTCLCPEGCAWMLRHPCWTALVTMLVLALLHEIFRRSGRKTRQKIRTRRTEVSVI